MTPAAYGQEMTETLDPKKLSPKVQLLYDKLTAKVIGQDRAIRQVIKAYTPMTINMHRENRPLGVFLFMGPTGVGKTETVRSFAQLLLGSRNSLTRIDCVEYQEGHEVSKLLGAPPGYLGYNDEPRLTQKAIDKFQTKQSQVNVVLFDEIEKAHSRLFDAIMTILGDARLTLGSGKTVDFSQSFVFLTSNLGSAEVQSMIEGRGIGFQPSVQEREDMDERVYRMSKEAAKKQFRPEFINRLDSTVVFRSLSRDSLRRILRIELEDLQWRIWKSPWRGVDLAKLTKVPEGRSIIFFLTEEAKEFLLDEGTSELYGARELNRAIERFVGFPMASLIASEQLTSGDRVKISYESGAKELTFQKMGRL
jgi:ATP-dependent Clp protease ATP-binding subunit ClpB